MPTEFETLLTTQKAAELLTVSPRTVEAWRSRAADDEDPGPPFVRVGGSVRYRLADLAAWIEKNVARRCA